MFIVNPVSCGWLLAGSLRGSDGLRPALAHDLVRDGQQIAAGNIFGFIRELGNSQVAFIEFLDAGFIADFDQRLTPVEIGGVEFRKSAYA